MPAFRRSLQHICLSFTLDLLFWILSVLLLLSCNIFSIQIDGAAEPLYGTPYQVPDYDDMTVKRCHRQHCKRVDMNTLIQYEKYIRWQWKVVWKRTTTWCNNRQVTACRSQWRSWCSEQWSATGASSAHLSYNMCTHTRTHTHTEYQLYQMAGDTDDPIWHASSRSGEGL